MATSNYVIALVNREDDSRVSIMYPTGELPMEELIRRYVDTSKPFQVMDISNLPNEDGDYFEAWQLVPKNESPNQYDVKVHLERAKDMHRQKLRQDRKQRLEDLDVAFMRAVEQGDTVLQQTIATKKQELRDVPTHPSIDMATTPVELRALTLDVLISSAFTQ